MRRMRRPERKRVKNTGSESNPQLTIPHLLDPDIDVAKLLRDRLTGEYDLRRQSYDDQLEYLQASNLTEHGTKPGKTILRWQVVKGPTKTRPGSSERMESKSGSTPWKRKRTRCCQIPSRRKICAMNHRRHRRCTRGDGERKSVWHDGDEEEKSPREPFGQKRRRSVHTPSTRPWTVSGIPKATFAPKSTLPFFTRFP